MSDQFDWRTDDDVWVEEPVGEREPATAVAGPYAWIFALSILLFLALMIRVIYGQLTERIEMMQNAVEEDILLVHSLVRQANHQQDVELLRSLLSGSDPAWTKVQLDMAAEGRLFDRRGLKLYAQPDIENVQVIVAPDFEVAELVYEQHYAWQDVNGVTETVRLQQTAVYRRGENWLYAPATDDYWGSWQTLDGRFLSIAYPQRDQVIVQQLAFDLEAHIAEVCRLPSIACPPDLHLHLRLDNDPESLLGTADADSLLNHTLHLNLPAPSLTGLPVDEAGYQALVQGYSIHLAAAVISQQTAYRCCSPELLHRALLDWHLHQLGLRPWPLTAAYYDQLLYYNVQIEDFRRFWHSPPTAQKPLDVYALVQFIATNSAHSSPIASQRLLNEDLTYGRWLAQVAGPDAETDFLQFIVNQSNLSPQAEPPIPLPEEDILYVCNGHQVQRQDWQTGLIEDVTMPYHTTNYLGLWPLRDGYLIEAGAQLTRVEENGRYTHLLNATNLSEVTYFGGAMDPTERYLVIYSFSSEQNETTIALLDSADCGEHNCQTIPISGWPLWSPSGQSMLILEQTAVNSFPPLGTLYLTNATGQNRIRLAENVNISTAAWLDNQTIAYVRYEEDEQIIVTRRVGTTLELVVARSHDLQALIPDPDSQATWQIMNLQSHPADPSLLLISVVVNRLPGLAYYFLLQWQNEETSLTLLPLSPNTFYSYFSPDGRLLLSGHTSASRTEAESQFSIYNLEAGEQITLADRGLRPGWSADGNWMALLYNQYLILMAPAHGYAQAIPGDYANCHNVIWVQP